mmetsp:Transcript_8812/g.14667  ORF Transcript_8812/g.14667 Transcript_8812/m.14667 type:complete len:410 (-) Transcript_8812:855-2084(-)
MKVNSRNSIMCWKNLCTILLISSYGLSYQLFGTPSRNNFHPNSPVGLPTRVQVSSTATSTLAIARGIYRECPSRKPTFLSNSHQHESNKDFKGLHSVLNTGTNLFPFWVLSFSILGFYRPSIFLWFVPYVTAALTLTMICMGMTLTLNDFNDVASSWRLVLLGFVAQYSIMPFSAALLSKAFALKSELASGLILVGCAPGGTASNLVTMIAEADLALSIMMTAASTVAAVVMTPLMVTRLAGSYVTIQASDLVKSTLSVVLLPVALGLLLNTNYPRVCTSVAGYTPFLSVLLVALICGSISASNSAIVNGVLSLKLIAAIISLHSMGFGVGYLFAKLCRAEDSQARTISIETGMQNSALAVVLARHFPNPQLCALPGALSATCHSIIGSILAALWRRQSRSSARGSALK